MSNNTAPDNWESQADAASTDNSPDQNTDVTAKFSTLNVNAVEFVPSFSFSKSPTDADEDSPTKSQVLDPSPDHSPVLNGKPPSSNLHNNCQQWPPHFTAPKRLI